MWCWRKRINLAKRLVFAFLFTLPAFAGQFTLRFQAEPITLDWTYANTNYETYVLMNIMEGLVELDSKLVPGPALADRWEVSGNGLVYRFHLKPGVKWSDGTPLRARDFVFSWHRLLAPANHNEYSSFLSDVENAEAYHRGSLGDFNRVGIKSIGDTDLEVRLRRPVPYFPSLLSFWVTFPQREDLVRKHGKGWAAPGRLVTLGPYRIKEWERGKRIVFEANSGYHGPAPTVSRVIAVIERSDSASRELLAKGAIDALLEVSTADAANYLGSDGPGFSLKQFNYLALDFLAFNTRAGPLAKPNLRRALAMAVDRGRLPAALQGGQLAAESLIPKGLAGYDTEAALEFSLPKARELLGHAPFPALSIVAREGAQADAARFVAGSLRENLGLTVSVRAVAPAAFHQIIKSGAFSMYVGHWGADYPDPSSFMRLMLSDSASNHTGWKNAEYDQLVKKANTTAKVLERLKAYSEAQKLLQRDQAVVVPLDYPKITALVRDRVESLEIDPLNYLFFKRIRVR